MESNRAYDFVKFRSCHIVLGNLEKVVATLKTDPSQERLAVDSARCVKEEIGRVVSRQLAAVRRLNQGKIRLPYRHCVSQPFHGYPLVLLASNEVSDGTRSQEEQNEEIGDEAVEHRWPLCRLSRIGIGLRLVLVLDS